MKSICLGTVQFGLDYGIANSKGKPDIYEVENIVRCALTNGVQLFDTAQSYGDSEKVLGNVFRNLNCNKDVSVITKLHPEIDLNDESSILMAIKKSLNNLEIDQLWGLMLHRPSQLINSSNFNKNIKLLKDKKLIKNFGVSVYSPDDAIRSINHPSVDIVQVPFNILDRRLLDNNFFELAKEKKKTIFIRSIFLQGLFLMNDFQLSLKGLDWVKPYLKRLRTFLNKNQLDINTFALNAVAHTQEEAVIILGVDSEKQLVQNINSLSKSQNLNLEINDWWKELPLYPERLLNPSMW
ncbi:aldo/keto reductase [Flavobacteriaceae bacterium]|nr:aldo/keto reductase [Flavobacteriaceae bacterium]